MKSFFAIVATFMFAGCAARTESLWAYRTSQPIGAAAIVQDGSRLVLATPTAVSIVNVETGLEVGRIRGVGVALRAIACSSAACWVGGGEHENGFLGQLDLQRLEIKKVASSEGLAAINSIAIRADGSVVTGHSDEKVVLWDPQGVKISTLVIPGATEIYAVGAIGNNVVAGTSAGDLVLWDGASEKPTRRESIGDAVLSIAVSGDRVLIGGARHLTAVDVADFSKKDQIDIGDSMLGPCDVASNGRTFLCGEPNGSLLLFDSNGKRLASLKLGSDLFRLVKLSDRAVIAVSRDKEALAWSLKKVVRDSDR